MAEQDFRCRGCSSKVEKKYAGKFRYCNYFGRYFCTSCHSGGHSLIPAKIVLKWNFRE